MVQIPEYTRRENAQPMQRGGMNLNLPGAITQPTGGIGEIGKRVGKLSSELADVFVGMKERRDDGIVSAFMNQYDKDSTAKLLQLQDKYRGQDAHRVMPEFQKWRDEYIAQHSTYDEDSAKEGVIYLEDAAQNRIAKQKLDATNVRDINSISSYIAREEETFRVNNLNTLISNNATKIMSEDDFENAEILKQSIKGDVASLYRGQSGAYIKKAYDDILDQAIYANIMRDSQTNPLGSMARYKNKQFTRELKDATRMEARDGIVKSLKNYASQVIAEDTAYGRDPRMALPALLSDDFFDGLDVNAIQRDIIDEASKREKDIIKTKQENNARLQNDIILKVVDKDGQININGLSTEDMMNIAATAGGKETINFINQVRVNTQNDDYNIENGLDRMELTDSDLSRYSTVRGRLNSGYYRTIGEMYDDLYMAKADVQNTLVGEFIGNLKYERDVEALKARGIDIEKDIDVSYANLVGPKAEENDTSFQAFRNAVVSEVRNMQMRGEKVDEQSIRRAALNVRNKIYDGTSDDAVVNRIVMEMKRKQKENYKPGSVKNYEDLQKWATELANDNDLDDVFSKESQKRFNDLILTGDVDSAILMLQYYRKSRAAQIRRAEMERNKRAGDTSFRDTYLFRMNEA